MNRSRSHDTDAISRVYPSWLPALRAAGYQLAAIEREDIRAAVASGLSAWRIELPRAGVLMPSTARGAQ